MSFDHFVRRLHLYLALTLLPWFFVYGISSIPFSHNSYFEGRFRSRGRICFFFFFPRLFSRRGRAASRLRRPPSGSLFVLLPGRGRLYVLGRFREALLDNGLAAAGFILGFPLNFGSSRRGFVLRGFWGILPFQVHEYVAQSRVQVHFHGGPFLFKF